MRLNTASHTVLRAFVQPREEGTEPSLCVSVPGSSTLDRWIRGAQSREEAGRMGMKLRLSVYVCVYRCLFAYIPLFLSISLSVSVYLPQALRPSIHLCSHSSRPQEAGPQANSSCMEMKAENNSVSPPRVALVRTPRLHKPRKAFAPL